MTKCDVKKILHMTKNSPQAPPVVPVTNIRYASGIKQQCLATYNWSVKLYLGCCHIALATWIHRRSDPWLTFQLTLSVHPIHNYVLLLPPACLSPKRLLNLKLRVWVKLCLLQSEEKKQ